MCSFPVPAALVEQARRFYASGAEPVVPRVAATVVLLQPPLEVYLLRRASTMAFASGMYAFPGGSVDPRDSAGGLDWAGPSDVDWAVRLGLPPGAAQAVVCAAVRELFEESGVLLVAPSALPTGSGQSSSAPTRWAEQKDAGLEAARQALVSRELSLADLLRSRGLALNSQLLEPWARWVTPEFEPRRFDTYFFLAVLPPGQDARDVSGEADHTMWVRPAVALEQVAAREIAMLPPTIVMLRDLAGYSDVDSVLAAAAGRDAASPVMPALENGRLVVP
ncbi:MAG TPA: NUDIX hydrolase [Micromonosporaceae bacterium]|jgi:8-oxo-dGTP pyrophosphatase MutT (NUDIX family)|nr:NUDIX hydrolase [Micromonosporaceae bacterium]